MRHFTYSGESVQFLAVSGDNIALYHYMGSRVSIILF